MSKELDALKDLKKRNKALKKEGHFHIGTITMNTIESALQRLEAIESADGDEVGSLLEEIITYTIYPHKHITADIIQNNATKLKAYIKSQQAKIEQQEKELEELKSKAEKLRWYILDEGLFVDDKIFEFIESIGEDDE